MKISDDIKRRTPDLRGVADIRLMTLEDGAGRGQRLLVARNADGLGFEVAVDRGFDLSEFSFKGINVGWHSPNQMRFPSIEPSAEEGWGFFRNFDGFLVTCGLDHFGPPATADISNLNHPHLASMRRPLHGRIAAEPGRLSGYGVNENDATVWCEGVVRQASVFGEILELRRRISAPIFGSTIQIDDIVTNRGYRPTPHAILYHLNFGYPFLDEQTRLDGVSSAFAEDFQSVARIPLDDSGEKVDVLKSNALPDGQSVIIGNDALGIEVQLRYSAANLPSLFIWRAYQSGIFALGIEPAFKSADAEDSSKTLAPGETRTYRLELQASAVAI